MTRWTLIFVFGVTAAFADCPEGARSTTEAERAQYSAAMKKLEALVPAAPAGWKVDAPPVYPLANSTCKGVVFKSYSYTVTYTNLNRVADNNRRVEEMGRQVAELRKMPADKAAEMAELSKQSRALQRERPKVRAAGDQAAIADLEARIKDLDRRYAAIRRAHEDSIQPQILEITKRFQSESEGQSNVVRVTVESTGGKLSLRADGDKALAAEIVKLWNVSAS